MIPYSYNMVDMGGIDLAEANGIVVPGVYERITEAMNLCGDVILYNWKFAAIDIAPSAYSILQQSNSILINSLIQVTELDEIIVLGIDPPPPPVLPVEPLAVVENGVYEALPPVSGFNPVTVNVDTSIPFFPYINVYGSASISYIVRFEMDYTLFGVAINGQAVTQRINLAMSLNSNPIQFSELYYSPASSTGDEKRNARIIMANIHCSVGDVIQLSCSNTGSYTTIFIAGVPEVEVTEVTKVITTVATEAIGSYDEDGVCIYGYSNGQQKVATVDVVMYEADTIINGGIGAESYGAGFIFWLQ